MHLVTVCVVWFLTDYFFPGSFANFGMEYYQFIHAPASYDTNNNVNPLNPMDEMFPKITKYIFHTFGFSGIQKRMDIMCLLMSNILNEKFYYFLWHWYIFGGIISVGKIIRRSLMIIPFHVTGYVL